MINDLVDYYPDLLFQEETYFKGKNIQRFSQVLLQISIYGTIIVNLLEFLSAKVNKVININLPLFEITMLALISFTINIILHGTLVKKEMINLSNGY